MTLFILGEKNSLPFVDLVKSYIYIYIINNNNNKFLN